MNEYIYVYMWVRTVYSFRMKEASRAAHDMYYHVLWVSKYQRVSKCNLLRDRQSKLADSCLDISAIYFPTVDHERTKEVSLCLLCDLPEITGEDSKYD